jgi:uncharacterized LabA/DUF88 family protein
MKGAILVDWENVRTSLNKQNYYDADLDILKGLITKARIDLANRASTARMEYFGIFAPDSWHTPDLAAAVRKASEGVKFALVPSATAKNAADTTLIVDACRHLWVDRYDYFVIVSGDVDYVPLASAIRSEGFTCLLWAVDKDNTSALLARQDNLAYVPEVLGLEREASPTPDDMELFVLLCQRLIDSGEVLWNPNTALDKIAEYAVLDRLSLDKLYASADHKHYFVADDVKDERETYRRRLRLAYEDKYVSDILRGSDAILEAIGRAEVRNRPYSGAEALGALQGVLSWSSREQQRLIEALKQAGYVRANAGGNLSIGVPSGGMAPFVHLLDWQLLCGPIA